MSRNLQKDSKKWYNIAKYDEFTLKLEVIKMRSMAEIQADIDSTKRAKRAKGAGGVDQSQMDTWDEQLEGFDEEMKAAEAQQQNLQERVDQAKATGYILDEIEIDGVPAIAFSHTPENHELLAIAVQKRFITQEDAFNAKLSELQYRNDSQAKIIENGTADNQRLIHENGNLRDHMAQVNIEKEDAFQKLENATNIIAEKDAEIKRLQSQQTSAEAIPVAPLSEEEKETKLMAEVMGKQIKVVNVSPVDADSFLNKMFKATNAVTGADVEDYYIYLSLIGENSRKRYEEISEEAAEQLRADYAKKKAELEAQNNIPTIAPVNDVQEEVEAQPEETFQEEVQATDSGTTEETTGDTAQNEVVGEAEGQIGRYNPFPQTGDYETDIRNLQHAHLDLVDQVNLLKDRLSPPENAVQAAA